MHLYRSTHIHSSMDISSIYIYYKYQYIDYNITVVEFSMEHGGAWPVYQMDGECSLPYAFTAAARPQPPNGFLRRNLAHI